MEAQRARKQASSWINLTEKIPKVMEVPYLIIHK